MEGGRCRHGGKNKDVQEEEKVKSKRRKEKRQEKKKWKKGKILPIGIPRGKIEEKTMYRKERGRS